MRPQRACLVSPHPARRVLSTGPESCRRENMPRLHPSIVVEDIDSKPVKFGPIEDPAARKEMTHLRSEIAKAGKDAPERVPALEEELMTFISQHQRNLTLGEAVVQALRTPLTDD